jgi:uncharacterized protein
MSIAQDKGASPGRDLPYGWIALSLALVLVGYITTRSWERVKLRPPDRTITVTGSAKKQIVSDLIEWSAAIETEDGDRTAAYRKLHGHMDAARAYLSAQGVKDAEIALSSTSVEELYDTEYVGTGVERVERTVFRGYTTRQTLSVRSTDVARIERLSREITQLLEQGVPITSSAPAYYYTKLGELKIEMLAEAAKDARVRADNMIRQSGGASLGKLRAADMGVINVNPINSTATSWDGNNDTSSLEKDIITIVHVTFELR